MYSSSDIKLIIETKHPIDNAQEETNIENDVSIPDELIPEAAQAIHISLELYPIATNVIAEKLSGKVKPLLI